VPKNGVLPAGTMI